MSVTFCAVLFLTCLSQAVKCNDIRLGYASPQSSKVIGEIKEADPALWKRTDDVIVNAPANEVISAVFVTDLRDDKDGEAFIESGGVGEKSVTIGLKSPSILRGYRFEVEVYANNPSNQMYSKGGNGGYGGYGGNVGYSYSGDIQYPRKY